MAKENGAAKSGTHTSTGERVFIYAETALEKGLHEFTIGNDRKEFKVTPFEQKTPWAVTDKGRKTTKNTEEGNRKVDLLVINPEWKNAVNIKQQLQKTFSDMVVYETSEPVTRGLLHTVVCEKLHNTKVSAPHTPVEDTVEA